MSPSGARLATSYPARAACVAAARAAVSAFATRAGASADELDSVRLAVSEAVTNAVVHAYPGAPGPVHVTAAIAGRELSVIVADDGCGLGAARETRGLGLGLNLIERSCDSLTVGASRSGGTQLEMRFLLCAAAAEADPIQKAAPSRVVSLNPLRVAAFFHDRAAEGGT
jgi:anti-sigma regulatory factor (Ser/Thr protein kinase)